VGGGGRAGQDSWSELGGFGGWVGGFSHPVPLLLPLTVVTLVLMFTCRPIHTVLKESSAVMLLNHTSAVMYWL
jgi:hypothetical protein